MGYYENIINEDNKTFVDFYIKYYNTFDEKRLYDINNKAADLIARSPENCNYFDEFFTMLTDGEFVNVMIIMNVKEVSTIKQMIVTGVSKEDIINSINSEYIKKYVKNWDTFIDAIDKYVTIDISSIVDPPKAEPIEVEPPKVESSAAKVFNPDVFLEKPVQQNIMQHQAPQQVQQPVYQAPQLQQQTPQSVVLHQQCRPGNNVQILNYNPINPMEYNGFYGLFMDQFNNQVYLPVARPQYSNIENSFGCLLDNNSTNNDTTKIVEYLRKHVKFINPGKNNFTLTEVLSLVNLIKNNSKVKEYCEKYESIYNPSSIILNEVTDKYVLKGTKYNKAFSIDTQDDNHPIIIFFNTKPYYNGIVNGWINESAITVKK